MSELARKQVRKTYTVLKDCYGSKKIEDVIYEEVDVVELKDWFRYRDVETTQVFRAVIYCKESDEEYNKRVEQENELKEMRRKEYERLRDEFGGETEQ